MLDQSKIIGAIDVKMDVSVLEEKLSFKMLGFIFSLKMDRLPCISINLPYGHIWNTFVMSGLVLLVATRNCSISYEKGHA